MTTTFKPGQHPDADQLSAFIEQALPAHERAGVLAHLAVCTECRGVVALALPEEPAALPAPARPQAWFTGWMVFLPAAAAVAALAIFILFVHRQGPALQQQAQVSSAPVSVAPPQPESPPQPAKAATQQPQAEIAAPAIAVQPKRQVATANAVGGSAGAGLAAAPQAAGSDYNVGQNVVDANQSVQSAPAQSAVNSFAPSANNAAVSQNQSSDKAFAPRSAFHGGAVSGSIQSNDSLQQAGANTQSLQQQNRQQGSANQTVQVQAEAPPLVTTETAELNGVINGGERSNLSLTRQPVPSGLPLLSSAAQGPIVLAIDRHHAVFVSSDSGQHWKTVRAVWKGRAVMVEATSPVKKIALPESMANVESYAALSQGAVVAKKAGITLAGTVTDQTGAAVSRATVTVTDPQTRLARTVTTDANGRYIATGLEPGNYNLDATAQGFRSSHLSNVAVTASNENVANFKLFVGAASETVTVESSAASIELDAAPNLKAARKESVKPVSAPLFEIVTDKGVRWASADGLTWQQE